MTITIKKMAHAAIWVLTVALLSSTYILYLYSWGRYVFFGLAVAIALLSVASAPQRIALSIEPFFKKIFLFIIYVLLTSLWSWSVSNTISKTKTLLEICICYLPVLLYYKKESSIEPLLSTVMWTGYVVAMYTISTYGIDNLISAASSYTLRIDSTYDNINNIGMIVAYACVIQVYRIIYRKLSVSSLFILPSVFTIAATQSRKAFSILIIGTFLVILLKNVRNKRFMHTVLVFFAVVASSVVVLNLLSKASMFGGVFQRFEGMIAGFTGVGKADNSTIVRQQMRRAGMAQFYKTPILGIGIGASELLVSQDIGLKTYLHCNFVELLSCGGMIGFILFYGIYVYLLKNTVLIYGFDDEHTVICFVLMILNLIMDYGLVSYYSKLQYMFFVIYFLQANNLKQKYGRI